MVRAGGRETPPSAPSAAANCDAYASQSAPLAWGESFMDMVAKYERNSERQLYVYGISVSRCASCRHRLKSDATHCEACGHAVPTSFQNCMRCTAPKPGLWCFECDKYFCEPCHGEPHVLVLNGSAPEKHNCFPIDGSSGKLLRSGAWSSSILELAKTARRAQMRLREDLAKERAQASANDRRVDEGALAARLESLRADEKTRSGERERKLAAKETTFRRSSSSRPPPVPVSSSRRSSQVSQTQPGKSVQPSSVDARSRSPSPVPARPPVALAPAPRSSSPSPTRQQQPAAASAPAAPAVNPVSRPSIVGEIEPSAPASAGSRKRKSPTADVYEDMPLADPPRVPLRSASPAHGSAPPKLTAGPLPAMASGLSDGMTLYETLRQRKNMQFQRSHSATTSPAVSATAPPRPPASLAPQAPASPSKATPPLHHHDTDHQATPSSVKSDFSRTNERELPVSTTSSLSAPQGAVPESSAAVKSEPARTDDSSWSATQQPAPPAASASAPASSTAMADPSIASEDVFRDAIVGDYEKRNALVFELADKIAALGNAVRRATLQDLRTASTINERLALYQAKLAQEEKKRDHALARVFFFTPELLSFVRSVALASVQDSPYIVGPCHKKCFEHAQRIRDAQAQVEALRAKIEDAVSKGDMAALATLGQSMARLQDEIRDARKDRTGQFHIIYQFSKSLRDIMAASLAKDKQATSGHAG